MPCNIYLLVGDAKSVSEILHVDSFLIFVGIATHAVEVGTGPLTIVLGVRDVVEDVHLPPGEQHCFEIGQRGVHLSR